MLGNTMLLLTVFELLIWSALGVLFWRKQLQKRFPAMSVYLALRLGSAPLIFVLLMGEQHYGFHSWYYVAYFYLYWFLYSASAVTLYFIALEVFRAALSPFSGLVRFGTVIFRWAAVASFLLGASTLNISASRDVVLAVLYRLMRSVSILELCLLAFLCLAMNALRLSPRDLPFGIALGFGVQASSDFVLSTFWSRLSSMHSAGQFASEGITLLSLSIWMIYFALPARERKPVVVPATSTIYRWNEIASALGHKPPTLTVPQPANSFFLTDVEKVVEKVLAKNLQQGESGS